MPPADRLEPAHSPLHMETVIRLLIIGVLAAIVASLGSALFHLSRKERDSRKVARDLTIRIGLSLALFILLMIAWHLGIIAPHGLVPGSQPR
jgi:H+/Cl- antiporter ClcA